MSGSGSVRGNDPYNMDEMVMPLHDYINDPIAQDIVHNGATFQVTEFALFLSGCFLYKHCSE